MLKRGALALAVIGIAAGVAVMRGRPRSAGGSGSDSESGSGSESESGSESGSAVADRVEGSGTGTGTEARGEVGVVVSEGHVDDPRSRSERTLAEMAAIRQEVHLLEMQRLDARERGDTEAEARLDREIAAQRAEHERLHDTLTEPEGI